MSQCLWAYLRAVPGPSHHNDELSIVVYHLPEPPVGRSAELQQQTVPTTGHGRVRRSQHGFGMTDDPKMVFDDTRNQNRVSLAKNSLS